jgi:molecular chaperone DnaK
MAREKPVGIDLGTTNSAMAWVDESGRSDMIRNAEGEMTTPSVVLFGESEVVVGKNARNAVTTHPDLVAQWVKRDMGAPFYSHPIHGEYLPPEVIQACILRKLKLDIIGALGFETRAVITVPAYFDELRRKATADAGEMAGIKVVDIVNEPTAAALAFGEALGYLSPTGEPREQITVMVYDLGGGTFDVTLLKLAAGKVDTLATDGDVQLGGHDWDQRLVDYAAESFRKSYQLDPREDPATLNRLYQTVMEAKHTLSARSRASIRVDYMGRSSEVQILREQFEEMTADMLERTSYTSRQLLAAAGMKWKDVNRILLVGGSTRMPMVPRMLQALTGIEPDRMVNPDEAVARGAALYASHLLGKEGGGGPATTSFAVTNVNAHSLGIEGIEQDTMRKTNVILIPRNTALPAKRMERFVTKSEGQRSIVIKVLEGESSLPGECMAIGRTAVRDLPAGMPKGWPVEVTFEYGANGRLSVHAQVPGTHHQAKLDLERDVGLSGAGLARWKMPISTAAGFGAFEAAAVEVQASIAATGGEAATQPGVMPGGPQMAAPMALPPGVTPPPGVAPSFSGFAAAPIAPTAMPPGFSAPAAAPTAPPPAFGAANMPYAAPGYSHAAAAAPTAMPPTFGAVPMPVAPGVAPGFPGSGMSTAGPVAGPTGQFQPFGAVPIPTAAVAGNLSATSMQGALPPLTGSGSPQFDAFGTSPPAAAPADPAQPQRVTKRIRPPSFMKTPAGRIVGHIVASALGLGCGYALLRHIRPDLFPPLW